MPGPIVMVEFELGFKSGAVLGLLLGAVVVGSIMAGWYDGKLLVQAEACEARIAALPPRAPTDKEVLEQWFGKGSMSALRKRACTRL